MDSSRTATASSWESVKQCVSCPGRGAAFCTMHRRAGTQVDAECTMDPGSAAHRKGAAQHPGNAPAKLRRAFFREGLDAFLDLGAPHAVAMAAVGGFFIQPSAGELVDRALHAAHRERRVGGEN